MTRPQPEERKSLRHNRRKLEPRQIAAVLSDYADGVSLEVLARRFEVPQRTLSDLVKAAGVSRG